METINCPSCGGKVHIRIKHCKLLSCDYCGCPVLLEDDAVKNLGEQSSLAEIPSLLKLGHKYQYNKHRFMPYGRIQYDYGSGIWEEWWVVTAEQQGLWISIDEGDIAIQTPFEADRATRESLGHFGRLEIGEKVNIAGTKYKVTEKNSAKCVGIEGQLPKVILVDDTIKYIDLSSPKGDIMSLEYDKEGLSLYTGSWIDPFELKSL